MSYQNSTSYRRLSTILAMNFSDLKISTRLALLLAVLCIVGAALGVAGLVGMHRANTSLNTVYQDRVVPLKQIKQVSDAYSINVVDTAHKVRDGAVTVQQGLKAIAEAKSAIQSNWNAYLSTELVPEETRLVEQFRERQVRAEASVVDFEKLLKSADIAQLTTFAAKEMYPALDPLQEVLGALVEVQLNIAKAEYDNSESRYQRTVFAIALSIAASILLALGVGVFVIRSITTPLRSALELSDAIASGDLTQNIHVQGSNEMSQLLHGLKGMQTALVTLVSAVHKAPRTCLPHLQKSLRGTTISLRALKAKPAHSKKLQLRWKSSIRLCAKTPTTPAKPTSLRKTRPLLQCEAVKWWPMWFAPCETSTIAAARSPTSLA